MKAARFVIAMGLVSAGCAAAHPAARPTADSPAPSPTSPAVTAAPSSPAATPSHLAPSPPGLPAFTASVSGPLDPAAVPYSWHAGCPVPPSALRELTLTYYGFDHVAHTGHLMVNAAVTASVIRVFNILYDAHFPIYSVIPVDSFRGNDNTSMAADNTSGFNCRLAVASGPPSWSMHAYGEAIDVNTVQNPYLQPGQPVQPPAGAAYVNRSDHRPGMAYPGGVLVDAFASVGWGWGGNWSGGPDYQHFSVNGR